jgi:ATP-binding cassette subfamily C protein
MATLKKSLVPFMVIGIILGTLEYLAGIIAMVLGAYGIVLVVSSNSEPGLIKDIPELFGLLIGSAIAKGVLFYIHQLVAKYIYIRYPEIIDEYTQDSKENLSVLKDFYSKLLSPTTAAINVSIIMALFISYQYLIAGIIAAIAYVVVGGMIPSANGLEGIKLFDDFKIKSKRVNSWILNSMAGAEEITQKKATGKVLQKMDLLSEELDESERALIAFRRNQKVLGNTVLHIFSVIIIAVMLYAYYRQRVDLSQVLYATVGMLASFGPLVALSDVSDSLSRIMAAGNKILL